VFVTNASRLRSLLFVPGDSPSKLHKAKGLEADALIFDWEDAVRPADKPRAREATLRALASRADYPQPVFVRINALASEFFADDCAALDGQPADAVMLSKCESPAAVERVLSSTSLPLFLFLETPLGVLNAGAIAATSDRIAGLFFGAEDYSLAMGVTRTEGDPELLYGRSAVVTAARAYGLEAFESPYLDYRDIEGLENSTLRARNLGFSGRAAIHPAQVEVINRVFTPAAREVEEARKLLQKFDSQGCGVTGIDGKMVDEPVLERARRILARSS
jgi:citrate lyase beta subunit